MKKIYKLNKLFLTLFVVVLIALPLMGFSHSANAVLNNPTNAPGDGCLPDSGDPDCLNLGVPILCPDLQGSGGLIPCGRDYDDPDTAWDECEPCSLCKMIFMGQLIIEFLLKVAAVAAVLAIAFGGILYIFAAGSPGTIEKAKSMIKYVLIGFIMVFIAWALVDTLLAMFGYIDPVGGEWYSINC